MQLKPREKALLFGIDKLNDVELLAIILQTGSKNESVHVVAQRLIDKYKTLTNLVRQDYLELIQNYGIGQAKAIKIMALKTIIYSISSDNSRNKSINSAKDVYNITKAFAYQNQEVLIVVSLNVANYVIHVEPVFQGTVNQIQVHPREVFASAIKNMAASIILVHNHPSGNVKPSCADIKTTLMLMEVSDIVGIKIADHIIIGQHQYYSMRENEEIDF